MFKLVRVAIYTSKVYAKLCPVQKDGQVPKKYQSMKIYEKILIEMPPMNSKIIKKVQI